MMSPRFCRAIAIAALVWNLIGALSFIIQFTMNMDNLTGPAPDGARVYGQMPAWVWVTFATAVGAGLLGAILLLAKSALAVPVYALSLAAIVTLFGQNFLATDMLAVEGWHALLAPALIFGMGIVQLLYARIMRAKGVLR